MRLGHVSDCFPPRTGGIETQVSDLAAYQVAAGHEVHILTGTLGPAGERGGTVQDVGGVRVHRLGARMPFELPVNPRGPHLVAEALQAVPPDVVHVHAGVVSPFAYDGARRAVAAGLPTAITWHCLLDDIAPAVHRAVQVSRWRSVPAALSAVSSAAAERVSAVFEGQPVDVLPNGVDLDRWAPRGDPARADRPGERGPLRLVATMRLAPRKRAVPLVRAVADAASQLPPDRLRLTVLGSGPARGSVQAAVADSGLDHLVALRGQVPRDAVRATYEDADVFLAPAELEAFGIAALEARAAGLVVVARRGTGIAEFVVDGVDGLLVDDDAGMARAIVRLARDGDLLDRIAAHNRAQRPDFGWQRVLAAAQVEYERARSLVGMR